MERAAVIEAYLAGLKRKEVHPNTQPFVTISRESGAGGNSLSAALIKALAAQVPGLGAGWQMFDQELCQLVANDAKLGVSLDELVTEKYRSEAERFFYDLVSGRPTQYVAYKRIFGVIRLLAVLGKVIIVGRAGSQITKNMPLGIHVRLVAEERSRIVRMEKYLNVDRYEAERTVREQDRDRARLVRDFFNRDISDPHLYDAVFNTDRIPIPDIADILVGMIKRRAAQYPTPA